MEVGKVGWGYVGSSRHHATPHSFIHPRPGIAVGAGEIEEETAKELEATRKRLEETETALAQAQKEIADLQHELAKVRPASTSLSI